MRVVASRVRAFVVITCAAVSIAAWSVHARGQQNPNVPDNKPKPTGLMLGQVVDASTGRPILGAMVTISGASASENTGTATTAPRQVMSDSSGRFLFRELGRGRYSVRATSPGYVGAFYGQTKASGASQSVELTRDDEKRGDLTIKLWKTASISGVVVDEVSDPVVGLSVRVYIRQTSGGKLRYLSIGPTATTDDRGVYRFSDLSPGDYLVGILSTQTTVPLSTTEAYAAEMSAAAGSSFTNSDIYRELNASGAPSPSAPGYRVGDLMLQIPYSRNSGSSPPPSPADNAQTLLLYATQFFPTARTPAQATLVTLESGQNRPGIDFQLKLVPTVRVSGTVVGPSGPVRNFGLRLLPNGFDDFSSDSGLEAASTVTDPQGAFTFLGVAPGEYSVKALSIPRQQSKDSQMSTVEITGPNGVVMGMSSSAGPAASAPLPTEPTLWATTSVNVSESSVTGLTVSLRPGARISGHFVFEGSQNPPTADQLQRGSLSVTPLSGTPAIQFSLSAKRIEADGRFATTGYPPGRYNVTAFFPLAAPGGPAPVSPSSWTFKSATVGGRNVGDDGLELAGEDISDLVITFTDHPSELSGTVLDASGKFDSTASVIIISADWQGWRQGVLNARRVRSLRATTAGSYLAGGLFAGKYNVIAVQESAIADWQDPKTLEKLFALGTPISIGDGEKKTLSLTTTVVR